MGRSEELFERAVKRIPGGVNSPVRAYGAIGMAPRFIKRADGCHIYDVDGNEYVDYIDSWGPMILGHNFPQIREAVVEACADGLSFGCATEIEVEMAEFICEHLPHVEMVRMVNSGTEAVIRISKQQEKRATPRITQIVLICRLITLRIFLTHWIFRTICRLCILQEPYSMHSLGRSFRTGRQRQLWYVRLQRIIACPITLSHRPIPYVRSTATSAASISPARNVERRLRFTAVSQDITALYRTGMMVRPRSTRIVPSMILPIPS